MNKNYVSPHAEVKSFMVEDVIAASGVTNSTLTALEKVNFANSHANVSWKDKISK